MNFLIGLTAKDFQQYPNFLESFSFLVSKLKPYDITWYLSPPYNENYGSRRLDLSEYSTLKEQSKIIREYNQKIQLALNTRNQTDSELYSNIQHFREDFGEISSIVTLDEYIPYLKQFNIPLVYSFNNSSLKSNLKYCTTVVLGRKDIRNIQLMRKLKSSGLKIELLVNNGCHFYCNRKCGLEADCKFLFLKRVQQVGKLQCLAEQSLLPEELNLYPEDMIDYIKLSTRPSSLSYIQKVFNDYSSKQTSSSLKDLELVKNWIYYSRQGHLLDILSRERIPVFEVLDKKERIWLEIYSKNNFMKNKTLGVFGELKEKLLSGF